VLPLVELEPEVDELVELEVDELVELEVEELVEVLEVMLPDVDELVDTLPELEVVLVMVPELVEVELPPVEVDVELPPVEVELPVLELSISITMPLVPPEVVVVVDTLTLPPLLPPTKPPKKPPELPKPPEPPITIGVPPPLLPQHAIAGAGNCGSGIGIGTIANSCGGSITRSAVGALGGIVRRAGRSLIGRSGAALADL
jgi:hypothetical protein